MKKIIGLIFILLVCLAVWAVRQSPSLGINEKGILDLGSAALKKKSPYSLKAGSALARVIDQQGHGIGDAVVTFSIRLVTDCIGNASEEPPLWNGTAVTTNEKGEFLIPPELWLFKGEKKRTIYVEIEAVGFLIRRHVSLGVNYDRDTGEIDIFRAGSVAGILIGPQGNAVGGAPIRLSTLIRYKNPDASCRGCYDDTVRTDEEGMFVFEKVAPGNHVVKFPGQAGGCADTSKVKFPFKEYAAFAIFEMKDAEHKDDIILDIGESRASVTGRVVDASGDDMVGVNVYVTHAQELYYENGFSTGSTHIKTATTDLNGMYVLTNLPAGDFKLYGAYPYEEGKNYTKGDDVDIVLSGKQVLNSNLVLLRQDGS